MTQMGSRYNNRHNGNNQPNFIAQDIAFLEKSETASSGILASSGIALSACIAFCVAAVAYMSCSSKK
jgi:hypothetical protein